jgi:tetratricopeptide (TPR) repeat protein
MFAVQLVVLFAAAQQVSSTATLWEQAKTALDSGQFAEARGLLIKAVQISPKDPALWFHLGVSYSELNQVDEAIDALEKAHRLAPDKAEPDFNLGLLYWKRGDVGKAKEAYRAGLALDPKQTGALQNYSVLLMKTGESEKAIEPLLALKNVPELSLASRVSLIECYLKTKDRQGAGRETDELLQSGLAPPKDQTAIAAVLIQENDPEVAEKVLRNSLKLDPDQAKAHAALGVILMNRKSYEEAASSLETAVRLQPDSAEFAMAFSESLLLWNRPTTLLVFLKSVEPRFQALPEFQYKLALAYYGVQEFSNAVDTLESLLRTNLRRKDQVYYILGNSYFPMGKFDRSEAAFRKAIELNPKEPDYYENLATLLRKEGPEHLDDAILQLKRASEFAASDARVALELGLCYESKGELKGAATFLENAVAKQPGLVPAHVALARIYFRMGRKSDGRKEKTTIASLEQKRQQQRLDPKRAGNEAIVDDQIQ